MKRKVSGAPGAATQWQAGLDPRQVACLQAFEWLEAACASWMLSLPQGLWVFFFRFSESAAASAPTPRCRQWACRRERRRSPWNSAVRGHWCSRNHLPEPGRGARIPSSIGSECREFGGCLTRNAAWPKVEGCVVQLLLAPSPLTSMPASSLGYSATILARDVKVVV